MNLPASGANLFWLPAVAGYTRSFPNSKILTAICCCCCCCCVESPEDGWLSPRTLFVLEVLFITVYALDVCLKASYMGLKNYVKKPWQKLMIAIVLLLAVDASGVVGLRFARALRPGTLVSRDGWAGCAEMVGGCDRAAARKIDSRFVISTSLCRWCWHGLSGSAVLCESSGVA